MAHFRRDLDKITETIIPNLQQTLMEAIKENSNKDVDFKREIYDKVNALRIAVAKLETICKKNHDGG